ncbi:tetratricopeptide repeat protein 39B-like [Ischnura elegans]|uniref:tetratricopeptide repeat protein 39B-like n=1 Tax=Ischnura elegans TaxID=197161 RepID=UPI001ED88E4A|nr:tetratricopeptide repeat protein 39B-like [Ischnura elegans]XP_046407173.1 tetratricopeptide repeat protein 39B-like [Ischnura elegans]XP_046407174.1 tetratricopeptide repeat protein 39B-like [Ischnura elegans]
MDDFDVDDEFQDANEFIPESSPIDLEVAMEEAKTAVHYFFNNKFIEAKNILDPRANSSMYHSLGSCVFKFLEALLTFEQRHIEVASEALKQCMAVCNRHRKKSTLTDSLGKMVKRTNYDNYSPVEIHAELCYAESLLLKSMLTFIEDETLVSFIKAGLKIRSCYGSYKECGNILRNRNWEKESYKIHFESGVRMGIGAFNLMISLLPARVIKLLEFIGFSGSKEVGLKELALGYNLFNSLRQVLCVMVLLAYHLIVVVVLSHTDGDLNFCEEILKKELKIYPDGVWFLFFKGRLEFMKGNISEAIGWYEKSWKSQNLWPQFHHLCFWELMWTNCVCQNWREASQFADKLICESRWSRTIYSYQKGAMLLMIKDPTAEEVKEIESLMKNAPQWKQRIAGKSLPMEKFAVKKTERYFAQGKTLLLPAFELLYVWNLFKVLGKKWQLVEGVYKLVEEELKLLNNKPANEYNADNKGLLLLLKAACLRAMGSPLQAEECIQSLLALEKSIKEDNYLIPYGVVELALLQKEQGFDDKAIQLLEDAKRIYTGYSLESRLHFKIHSALLELQSDRKVINEAAATEMSTL